VHGLKASQERYERCGREYGIEPIVSVVMTMNLIGGESKEEEDGAE